jgi:hypothetical protein
MPATVRTTLSRGPNPSRRLVRPVLPARDRAADDNERTREILRTNPRTRAAPAFRPRTNPRTNPTAAPARPAVRRSRTHPPVRPPSHAGKRRERDTFSEQDQPRSLHGGVPAAVHGVDRVPHRALRRSLIASWLLLSAGAASAASSEACPPDPRGLAPGCPAQLTPADPVSEAQGANPGAGPRETEPDQQTEHAALLAIKDAIHSLVRELSESEEEKAEVAKKSEQEAADLKAQQEMSFWAEGIFYATIVQIMLSLVGIWFIWQTLKLRWMRSMRLTKLPKRREVPSLSPRIRLNANSGLMSSPSEPGFSDSRLASRWKSR